MSDLSGNFADLDALAAASDGGVAEAVPITWEPEQQSQVSFTTQNIPPSALYVPNGSMLLVRIWPRLAVPLFVSVRLMRPDGTIMTGKQGFGQIIVGVLNVYTINLTEGFLLDVAAEGGVFGPGVPRGSCFVSIGLTRSTAFNSTSEMALVSGYLSGPFPLGWPGGKLHPPVEGKGYTQVIIGAEPAPGQPFSEQVPTNIRRIIKAVQFGFQTSASAGNRSVRLEFEDASLNGYTLFQSPATQGPSQQVFYFFTPSPATTSANFGQAVPMPEQEMPQQGVMTGIALNMDPVADQFFLLAYLVEEWIDT